MFFFPTLLRLGGMGETCYTHIVDTICTKPEDGVPAKVRFFFYRFISKQLIVIANIHIFFIFYAMGMIVNLVQPL